MSGSSGSGHYIQEPVPEQNCRSIRLQKDVSSPVPSVIARLSLGSVLDVSISGVLVVVTHNGNEAGSLVGDGIPALKRCIGEGNIFSATVVKISGASIQVQVSWKA